MVLSSGNPPYEYANGRGRLNTGSPTAGSSLLTGPSGILLEQAQFVITAELRRWRESIDSHDLPTFYKLTNPFIAPEGPYEPQADGSTLAGLANILFIDSILQTRDAIDLVISEISDDTNLDDDEYRAAWLQALYPESPSGYLVDQFGEVGFFLHRPPATSGAILDVSQEVLGGSGVLYEIDFGEVMFNPPPHVTRYLQATAHGRATDGSSATFVVQVSPFFPAFQKTDGSLITVGSRDPEVSPLSSLYNTTHFASGVVRLDGYVITSGTEFYLGKKGEVFDRIEDFTFADGSVRTAGFNNQMPHSRVYLTPSAMGSGVYQVGVRNPLSRFTTTIESGLMSHWPTIEDGWPTTRQSQLNNADGLFNTGYHVFDDAIWITDRSPDGTSSNNRGRASGLAVLSPYTGHKMYVRYADLTPSSLGNAYPYHVGLERVASNRIIRVDNEMALNPLALGASGRWNFIEYDDNLDYVTETLSTSPNTFPADYFSTGAGTFTPPGAWDAVFDGTSWFVFNDQLTGFAAWEFSSTYVFQGMYQIAQTGTPMSFKNVRMGADATGNLYLYYAAIGSSSANVVQSGIAAVTGVTPPADLGGAIPGTIDIEDYKYIRAEHLVGHRAFATIMDFFEVTNGTHTPNGIYVLINYEDTSPFSSGPTYLLEIEEDVSEWTVKAAYRIEGSTGSFPARWEGLHMDIN